MSEKKTRKIWTEEEDNFLRFAYPQKEITVKEIANSISRTIESITSRARKLGLKRYKEEIEEGYKRCPSCKIKLSREYFHKEKLRYDGVAAYCKECRNEKAKRKYKEKIKKGVYGDKEEGTLMSNLCEEVADIKEKKCKVCEEVKNINEFPKDKKIKDGYSNKCKECKRKYDEEYKIRKIKERGW